MFYWSAWGITIPSAGGQSKIPGARRFVSNLNEDGSTGIIADLSIGGSRVQTNAGDLVDRTTALDGIIPPGYPSAVGVRMSTNADTRQRRKYILSLQIGTNPDSSDPVQQASIVGAYCIARRNAGWDGIVLGTLCSRGDGIIANFDTAYQQPYNAIIKGTGWAAAHGVTAIADIASDSRLGASGANSNTTYFEDLVHPTAEGAAIGGPILRAAFDQVIASL